MVRTTRHGRKVWTGAGPYDPRSLAGAPPWQDLGISDVFGADAACATLFRVTIEAMIEQALRLSVEDRTELVARLLESLDEAAPAAPGHEAAWTEVIHRRLQDL